MPAVGPQSGDESNIFNLLPSICVGFYLAVILILLLTTALMQQVREAQCSRH